MKAPRSFRNTSKAPNPSDAPGPAPPQLQVPLQPSTQCPDFQVYLQRENNSWSFYCQEAASLMTRRGISHPKFHPQLAPPYPALLVVMKTRPKCLRQQKAAGFHLPDKHRPGPKLFSSKCSFTKIIFYFHNGTELRVWVFIPET